MEFSVFNYPSVRLPFTFHSSKEVYESMKEYQKSDREMFLILFLDSKNNVLNIEPHTIGTIDSCAVYPREVFKSALLNSANSIICVHHHPSGDSEPSESDRQLTKELVLGGKFLGIKVLDHIILGKNQYFSFADIGLMEEYESSLIEYK
jgi:DNA repair protein RadC